uniref:Uncharacterized protein n=1 Tax=Plectus sambesii TaxID=2011161 RepID=A0A914XI28_9BILA
MIIQILLLLLLDSYASSSNCNPDANREFLKSLRRGGKVLSGLNTVMGGIYGFAAKALDSSNDNMFKCFAEIIKDAQENHRLSVRTTDQHFHHQNMLTLLIESNSILADCAVVREHYAPYHASNELSTEDEFRTACRQNNPNSALVKFAKFVEQHDLFVALIRVTSHRDNLYSTTGISLLNETASCAVLAEKCRETLYPNWSDKLSAKRNTTLARLAKIEEAFWKGRNALVTNYSTSARDDLHHMLLTEDFSPRNRQQAINEMHDFMTSKYPYRAWALIIFDE